MLSHPSTHSHTRHGLAITTQRLTLVSRAQISIAEWHSKARSIFKVFSSCSNTVPDSSRFCIELWLLNLCWHEHVGPHEISGKALWQAMTVSPLLATLSSAYDLM